MRIVGGSWAMRRPLAVRKSTHPLERGCLAIGCNEHQQHWPWGPSAHPKRPPSPAPVLLWEAPRGHLALPWDPGSCLN